MSAETDFKTLDGAAWAKALTEARKRRSGQGKRVAEAVAKAKADKSARRIASAQQLMNTAPTKELTLYWMRIWRARRRIAETNRESTT